MQNSKRKSKYGRGLAWVLSGGLQAQHTCWCCKGVPRWVQCPCHTQEDCALAGPCQQTKRKTMQQVLVSIPRTWARWCPPGCLDQKFKVTPTDKFGASLGCTKPFSKQGKIPGAVVPLIPARQRQRQAEHQANQGYIWRPCLYHSGT